MNESCEKAEQRLEEFSNRQKKENKSGISSYLQGVQGISNPLDYFKAANIPNPKIEKIKCESEHEDRRRTMSEDKLVELANMSLYYSAP